MKKFIVLVLSMYTLSQTTSAQCEPSPAVTNVYQPVGNVALPPGGVLVPTSFFAYPGQQLNQVITALAPQQTEIANPIGFPPTISVDINWIRVTNINNLPSWLTYECGGQLDSNDPCKMAFPTWSCVSAYCTTPDGRVPLTETAGTVYSLDVIVDADVTPLGTQSDYNGGSLSLLILDSMTANLSYDPCNGGKITANGQGGFNDPGAFEYLWNNGQQTQTLTNVQPGLYICNITDQVTGWSANASLEVENVYTPIIINDGQINIPNGGANGSIEINVTGGNANYSYLWSGPNNFTANTNSISNLSSGTYTVTVTDANNCTKTKTFFLSGVGIENATLNNLVIYPNPTSGVINITGYQTNSEDLEIEVVSEKGMVVYQLKKKTNQDSIPLNLSYLPQARYILKIRQGQFTQTKFVVIN